MSENRCAVKLFAKYDASKYIRVDWKATQKHQLPLVPNETAFPATCTYFGRTAHTTLLKSISAFLFLRAEQLHRKIRTVV